MPNPNPPRRQRADPAILPSGYSIHKSGRLRYRFTDPQRGRVEVYGSSVAEIEAKLRPGVAAKGDTRLTVADYLRVWCDTRRGAVRANTWTADTDIVARLLIPGLGERLRLVDLSTEHVERLLADLTHHRTRAGRPYAPRTIAIVRATLRKALAPAVPARIPRNPAADAKLPIVGRNVARVGVDIPVPSPEILRAVERRLRERRDPLHPLFVVATLTGMRQSELLGLRWSAIDLGPKGGSLIVREVLLRDTVNLDAPKSQSSARAIRFGPMVASALHARRKAQIIAPIDGLVFTDRFGAPLRGRQVTRRFQRQLAALGLPRFDWKSLRHAFVTGLIEGGVELAVASKAAGHSSVAITSDIYTHYTRPMQDQVAGVSAARLAR